MFNNGAGNNDGLAEEAELGPPVAGPYAALDPARARVKGSPLLVEPAERR